MFLNFQLLFSFCHMSWSLSPHGMWSIIWEEYMPSAHVLFFCGILPSSPNCFVSSECWVLSLQPGQAAIFFLGSIPMHYNLENALREKSRINSPSLKSQPLMFCLHWLCYNGFKHFLHILCRFCHCIWQENLSSRSYSIMVGLRSLFSVLSEEI